MPAILYGSEAWSLKGSEMNFVKDGEKNGENNVSSTTER